MPSRSWQFGLLFLLFIIALFRFFVWQLRPATIIGPAKITAVIENEPKIRSSTQVFRIGELTVITKSIPQYHYGDKLEINGEIEANKTVRYPRIKIIEKDNNSNLVNQFVESFRKRAYQVFATSLPEPQASTLAGMVLGIDKIPSDFISDLRRSGLIHLVVVSGQNITLLAGFVMLLAGVIERRLAIFLTLLIIVVYTLVAGGQPPVIRAAIMGSFAYFGQLVGRQVIGLLMLVWATVIMFLFEPEIIFNLSFALSFSATLGILIFAPYLKLFFKKPAYVSEALSVSVSAWILTLPVLVLAFHQASIVSVFSNILVSFVVLPIMILGFMMVFVGFILPQLAMLIGFIAYLPLSYLVLVARKFGQLPFAQLEIDKLNIIVVFCYYLLLFVIFTWLRKKYSIRF